jgi:Fe-S cluster assembly ATP-binding protein
MMLNPSLAILDETDSGLDVDAFKVVADAINSTRSKDNSMLIITHYQRLLERIQPDIVHVFVNGSITESGGPELANEIEKNGYERFSND